MSPREIRREHHPRRVPRVLATPLAVVLALGVLARWYAGRAWKAIRA